jgi:quercetin dioxygenase-like cupin family protein
MSMPYTLIPDLATHQAIPDDGIISRTIHRDARSKTVLFGFAADQELSEHTSAQPAILTIVTGQARLTLGDDVTDAGPGTWVHMPAGLRHGLLARTAVVMLLTLLSREPSPSI